MRNILKILMWAALGGVLIAGSFLIAAWVYLDRQLAKVEKHLLDDSIPAAHATEVAADLAALRGAALFRDADAPAGAKDKALDAGQFLNRRIAWNPASAQNAAAVPLGLPEELKDQLILWKSDWLAHRAEVDLGPFDFSWFTALRGFQYWDLETDGPLGDALARDPLLDPSRHPSPDMSLIDAWVKLRLMAAFTLQDPTLALTDVEKLAALLLTTESTPRAQSALSYLTEINRTAAALQVEGKLAEGWHGGMDPALIARARRALRALPAYLGFNAPPAAVARILPPGAPPPGTCGALAAAIPSLYLQREMLEPFFEERFHAATALVQRLLSGCRLGFARNYFTDSTHVPEPLTINLLELYALPDLDLNPATAPKEDDSGLLRWEDVKKVRFARRAFGLSFAGMAPSLLFQLYDEPQAQAADLP